MYAICDNQNIVRRFAASIAWVTAQTNGVTVGTAQDKAQAAYVPEDDTYWPLREVFPGQETFRVFEVESVPEGCEEGITRYNCGALEIDEELKAQADAEKEAAEKQSLVVPNLESARGDIRTLQSTILGLMNTIVTMQKEG